MNIESRNRELVQKNQILITQIENRDKDIVELEQKKADLSLEKIRQQEFANKLVLRNKKATAQLAALKKN